jgi:PAS domain S-box-containing protein
MRLGLRSLLLAASLPIVVFAVVMAVLFEEQQRRAVVDAVRQATLAASRSIDDRIGAVRYALEALATSEALSAPGAAGFEAQARRVLSLRPDWVGLRLTASDGLSRPVARDRVRLPDAAQAEIEAVQRYGQPRVSGIIVDPAGEQEPVVAITIAMTVEGGTVSTLSAYLRAWTVNRAVRDQGLSPDSRLVVVDAEGRRIARTTSEDPFDPGLGQPLSDAAAVTALQRGQDTFFARAQGGEELYAAAVRSAVTGWTVVLGVPAALIEQPIRNTRFAVIGGVALALVLAALVGVLLARSYTKRQEAERNLVTREAAGAAEGRAAAVLESMSDAVVELDRDGRIVYLNAQARRQFAGTDDFAGRMLPDLIPEAAMGRFRDELKRAAEGHVAGEFEHQAQSQHWQVRVAPSVDDGLTIYLQDIAARKRSERALAESHALLERVFEASSDPIFVKDRGGHYLMANSATAHAMAIERQTLIGKKDADFLPPDISARIEDADRRVMESRTESIVDMEFAGPVRGEPRILLVTKYPLRNPSGEVVGLVGMLKDITERKRVEERLRGSQRLEAVGRLTGGVAHDFNNLLQVVIGNLDLLASDPGIAPHARQLAEGGLAAALRGSDLTKRLLSFARLQPLKPTRFDLNEQLERIVPLLRRTLGDSITVQVRPAAGLWPVLADASQIDDAVINLSINARDAMPDGGRLTLETRNARLDEDYAARNADVSPGDYVVLSVTDTGVGMPPEVLARAVEPFYTTKEVGKGSGLGLAQVYGFARQSNGHLKLLSEVGHGTTVSLYLPRALAGEEPTVEAAAPSRRPVGGGETILFVDDDPFVRETLATALTGLGYRVLEASNGADALRVLEQHAEVQLLLSDVAMPGGMTGYDLVSRARDLRPGLPMLLSSGYAEHARRQASADPSVPMIAKPYRITDLAAAVRTALREAEPGAA